MKSTLLIHALQQFSSSKLTSKSFTYLSAGFWLTAFIRSSTTIQASLQAVFTANSLLVQTLFFRICPQILCNIFYSKVERVFMFVRFTSAHNIVSKHWFIKFGSSWSLLPDQCLLLVFSITSTNINSLQYIAYFVMRYIWKITLET